MKRNTVLLSALVLLLTGCSMGGPGAKIASAKYVETINTGGVFYSYEGKDNIQIVLDFKFDPSLASGLDPESADYRKEIYAILKKGAHFYNGDVEVESTWGYWPEKAGKNYAKEMSLFYVVPSGHSVDDLRFKYDGSILGKGASGIDTKVKPEKISED